MSLILRALAPHLPMLSVTALPTVLLGGMSLLIRPRGPLLAAHRRETWHAVPVAEVVARLDAERHTGELPVFSLVPYPQRWLAEDWRRAEVSA
jgi:hypothetical protein